MGYGGAGDAGTTKKPKSSPGSTSTEGSTPAK
jgi:hypothetical protein